MTTIEQLQISSSSNNHPNQMSEFNFFPPEIWTQIFTKLPAKTLLKFRNSNRSLLALEALECYANHRAGCLLTVRHLETLEESNHIFKKLDIYLYRIIGSCNGLLLVSRTGVFYESHKVLRLWNPSIRKSLVIPACPFPSPLLEDCVYVFGHAPVSKDYKVAVIGSLQGHGEEGRKMYIAVYRLRDQHWTARKSNFSFPNTIKMSQPFYCIEAAVFLKGVAYWLGNFHKYNDEFTHLGSFDFDKQEIAFSKLPSIWNREESFKFLFLLGESLAIFIISEVASSIWVLEQDDKMGTWTQNFSGKSSPDGYRGFKYLFGPKVFFCESDGGYFIYENISYNISTCELQRFRSLDNFNFQVEMYSESLVLSKEYGARDLRFFP